MGALTLLWLKRDDTSDAFLQHFVCLPEEYLKDSQEERETMHQKENEFNGKPIEPISLGSEERGMRR